MKRLPIGISDFKEIIEEDYYYVDKTLLIKELIGSGGKVVLIPRPRRFGKTLNLSMLRYFFEQAPTDTSYLFTNTNIWQELDYKTFQGQYPVIFLTFKDVKDHTWQNAYKNIIATVASEFNRHLASIKENIPAHLLERYTAFLTESADSSAYARSLLFLSEILYNHYNKKVIVLIDEYDAPIHSGYAHTYYSEVIEFLRPFLSTVFKDNVYLERGVLTGILRASKEGIFSGLNNLKSYTLTHTHFQDKFGFTTSEVKQLLKDQKLSDKLPEVQAWYNGYLCGTTTIYNPWSVIMCADDRGLLQPYWLNTSDNLLIKKLITSSGEEFKSDMELLLSDKPLEKEIDEAVIFPGIEDNPKALWSLLLFTGYLTYTKIVLDEGITTATLIIPNKELKILYKNLIKDIFETSLTGSNAKALLTALTTGDTASFEELLQEFISTSMSFYDLPSNEPEKSYHLFILGLLIFLSGDYEVKSNRESGLGRYDIMIIPKKPHKLGIIIEFKKVHNAKNETLEIAAQKALQQIQAKHYIQELKDRKIKNIILFGIAFQGKKIFILSRDA